MAVGGLHWSKQGMSAPLFFLVVLLTSFNTWSFLDLNFRNAGPFHHFFSVNSLESLSPLWSVDQLGFARLAHTSTDLDLSRLGSLKRD